MRFGIIGAGVIAEYHCNAIEAVADAQLVGVYDKLRQAAQNFATKHDIPAFDSIESLVQQGNCDVVTIATPSGWHLEPCIAAMEAGAHVISEKPLEITIERIDRMIDTAQMNNRKLGAILQIRTFPGCQKAKQILDEGRLGKILVADAYMKYYRTQEYYEESAWRGTWNLDGGGAAMNQGVHWIDLINWLMGDAEWIYAVAQTLGHQVEIEDICHAVIGWKCGAQGVLEATTCAKPGFETRIEIHGEHGSLLLEDTHIKKLILDGEPDYEESQQEAAGGHADPKVFSAAGHIIHIQDMIEAVRNDREPMVPGWDARRSVHLITSMYQSSQEDRKVFL